MASFKEPNSSYKKSQRHIINDTPRKKLDIQDLWSPSLETPVASSTPTKIMDQLRHSSLETPIIQSKKSACDFEFAKSPMNTLSTWKPSLLFNRLDPIQSTIDSPPNLLNSILLKDKNRNDLDFFKRTRSKCIGKTSRRVSLFSTDFETGLPLLNGSISEDLDDDSMLFEAIKDDILEESSDLNMHGKENYKGTQLLNDIIAGNQRDPIHITSCEPIVPQISSIQNENEIRYPNTDKQGVFMTGIAKRKTSSINFNVNQDLDVALVQSLVGTPQNKRHKSTPTFKRSIKVFQSIPLLKTVKVLDELQKTPILCRRHSDMNEKIRPETKSPTRKDLCTSELSSPFASQILIESQDLADFKDGGQQKNDSIAPLVEQCPENALLQGMKDEKKINRSCSYGSSTTESLSIHMFDSAPKDQFSLNRISSKTSIESKNTCSSLSSPILLKDSCPNSDSEDIDLDIDLSLTPKAITVNHMDHSTKIVDFILNDSVPDCSSGSGTHSQLLASSVLGNEDFDDTFDLENIPFENEADLDEDEFKDSQIATQYLAQLQMSQFDRSALAKNVSVEDFKTASGKQFAISLGSTEIGTMLLKEQEESGFEQVGFQGTTLLREQLKDLPAFSRLYRPIVLNDSQNVKIDFLKDCGGFRSPDIASIIEESEFIGFKTGTGKKITFASMNALEKSKCIIETSHCSEIINDVDADMEFSSLMKNSDRDDIKLKLQDKHLGFTTGGGFPIAEPRRKANQFAMKLLQESAPSDTLIDDIDSLSAVFTNATGKPLSTPSSKANEISEETIQNHQLSLKSEFENEPQPVIFSSGFTNGGGVPLSKPSEKATKFANDFMDEDTNLSKDRGNTSGFRTGNGKEFEVLSKSDIDISFENFEQSSLAMTPKQQSLKLNQSFTSTKKFRPPIINVTPKTSESKKVNRWNSSVPLFTSSKTPFVTPGKVNRPSGSLRNTPYKTPTITRPKLLHSTIKQEQKSIPKPKLVTSSVFEIDSTRKRNTLLEYFRGFKPLTIETGPWLCINPTNACSVTFDSWGVKNALEKLVNSGCNPSMCNEKWVENHYKWIVWKMAALIRRFNVKEIWTSDNLLSQLLYRYEIEVNQSQRSCLKLIVERDNISTAHIILCVSKLKEKSLELTDGWYKINTSIDPAIQRLIKYGKIFLGQKLHIQGATLNESEPYHILEVKPNLALCITANSTRPAKWFERLGYQAQSQFPISISSIIIDGGRIQCLDTIICRRYPTMVVEKMKDGKTKYRTLDEESLENEQWRRCYENAFEASFDEVLKNNSQVGAEECRRIATDEAYERCPKRNTSRIFNFEVCDHPPGEDMKRHCKYAIISLWMDRDLDNIKEGHRFLFTNLIPSPSTQDGKLLLRSTNQTLISEKPVTFSTVFIPRVLKNGKELLGCINGSQVDIVLAVLGNYWSEIAVSYQNRSKHDYRIICSDNSERMIVVDLSFDVEKSKYLKESNVLLFKNLKYLYSSERIDKLQFGRYSEMHFKMTRPFLKSDQMDDLHSWVKTDRFKTLRASSLQLLDQLSSGLTENALHLNSQEKRSYLETCAPLYHDTHFSSPTD